MNEEKIKQEAIEEYKKSQSHDMMTFAQQMNQIIIESMNTKNKTKFYKKYTPQQVETYLLDPARYEIQLRDISRYLTVSSPQYWRLVNYLPSIAVLKPYIAPLDMIKVMKNTSKTEKILKECMMYLDVMSIQHEFLKVLQTVFRDDIFYGYSIETETSYFIKELDPKYCRLKGKYDGCFTFEFDFSYFDTYKDELINYGQIDKEFESKYNDFKANSVFRWQELNLDREVCVKYQESFAFCCPPFISVFNDLYDLLEYKDMKKEKTAMDNSSFIGLKMPMRDSEKTNKDDDFTLTADTMKTYFAFMQSCLGGKTGLFMSPMDFTQIDLGKTGSANANNNVTEAIGSFWDGSGVSKNLFSESKSGSTLELSIKTDEALLFNVYRQIERILSRIIKLKSGSMFKVVLPDLTYFNVERLNKQYIANLQYGVAGSITMSELTSGISQNEAYGLSYLENDILKKHETMIPAQSSHTTSNTGDVGAPKKDSVKDSGEVTREQK